jgi:hypothetical protein
MAEQTLSRILPLLADAPQMTNFLKVSGRVKHYPANRDARAFAETETADRSKVCEADAVMNEIL